MWKTSQWLAFAALLFANVYFEWGAEGIAAPVAAGMAVWFGTRVIAAISDRWRFGRAVR